MRRNELTIIASLAVLGVIAAFWLVVISPKRDQAANLNEEVGALQASLAEAEEAAATGEQARDDFRLNYRNLVVLGKAVPADGDQAGLLVQVQRLADRAGVEFQSVDLSSGAQSASAPAPAPSSSESPTPPATPTTESVGETGTPVASSSTAPATEAAAATLPIGAAVGPAGLPVMPYDLKFTGDFFQIADFLESLDAMVHTPKVGVDVTGRLLTVDGFALAPEQTTGAPGASLSPTPTLTAALAVTTYLTPADQGVTAGATPTGPAPATATPTSSTTATTATPAPAPTSSEAPMP